MALEKVSVECVVVKILLADLSGELADEVRDELLGVAVTARNAVLDFSQVKSISASGFRPLLSLHRLLGQNGGRLALCHLHPSVRAILDEIRLLVSEKNPRAPFLVAPTVPEAVLLLYSLPRI